MVSVASISLTMDPAWPWSVPGTGLTALLIAAAALTGITVWTYHGVQNTSRSRILLLLGLRLAALVLYLPDPDRPLHEQQRLLKKGQAVTLIGESGAPEWHRYAFGKETSQAAAVTTPAMLRS